MKIISGICLAILFNLNSGFKVHSKQDNNDLVSVVVLFRDGDKAPTGSFPNDPYFDPAYWPMGFGQLTNMGIARHYELGKWLRTRYDSFLPTSYSSDDIYVRSTDVDRTLMSAAANLAGLFPPASTQVWNSDLLWRPVPIHTIPKDDDQILYMNSDCAKFYDLYEAQYDSDFFKNVNEEYAEFYEEVSKLTGWNITDLEVFGKLQSVLDVYASYDLSYLPSWASSLDQDKLNYLSALSYARYTFTDDLKRLGAGPFFDYLISHLDKAVADASSAPKLLLLSGHESTLVAALSGMDVFDLKPTAFASSIIWELRKTDDGVYFVNIYYKRNSDTDVPEELQLKDCQLDCDYATYKGILEPITVNMTIWEKECEE